MEIPDPKFAELVDADLRPPDARDPELSAELRHPEVVKRYYSALLRKAKSVDGQLAAKEAQYEGKVSRLKAKLTIAESQQGMPDATPEQVAEARRKATNYRAEISTARSQYFESRVGTIRFKTGLDMNLIEVRRLVDELDSSQFNTLAVQERNLLAGRVQVLEDAIRLHQEEIGDEGSEEDEALWGVLS